MKRTLPRKTPRMDLHNVFLNVPFDRAYEKQFLAVVAAIVLWGALLDVCWNSLRSERAD